MSSDKLQAHAQTGISEMDHEHALELELVRSIQEAIADSDPEKLTELLQQLEDLTNAHFLAEQLLMRLHAYPGYEAHQQEHDQLMTEFSEISQRLQAGASADATEDAAQLERWLLTHIQSSDQALAEYLKQQGVDT